MAAGERQFGMQPRDLGVPGQANVRPLAAADREPRGARRQLVDALSPLAVTQHQEGAPGGLGGDPLPQLGGRRGVDVQRRSAGGVGRQGGPDSTSDPTPAQACSRIPSGHRATLSGAEIVLRTATPEGTEVVRAHPAG
jgi:hypothetical protein